MTLFLGGAAINLSQPLKAELVTIPLDSGDTVSGLWLAPPSPRACLVLAHGAGAGMTHKSMAALATGFAERSVSTLRYQFLYMERGSKRPDPPALAPLTNVRGLVFFAFPLHPASKPSDERAAHLAEVDIPMLFLSGTNDALASLDLLRPVVTTLGARATLKPIDGADHSFHVPAKSGRKDAEVLAEVLDTAAAWMTR